MKKIFQTITISMLLLTLTFGSAISFAATKNELESDKKAKSESELEKEVDRKEPILLETQGEAIVEKEIQIKSTTLSAVDQTSSASALGTNLIANPSVETDSSVTGVPASWNKGGYGTNNRLFTHPTSGSNSTKAVKVEITSYTSGDAKWFFNEVPVTAGKTYEYSDSYISNITSYIVVRYALTTGTYIYRDIALPIPASTFTRVSSQDVAPANAVSATVFHLINRPGFLITDEFSFAEVTTTQPPIDPPPSSTGLVPNSNFEQTDANNIPVGWKKGGWGSNTRMHTYPVTGEDGSKAAQVTISSYTSGDAKWAFSPLSLQPGLYTYTDQFKSTVTSTVTLQLQNSNGIFTYKDLVFLSPTSEFQTIKTDFEVPPGTVQVSIFHVIKAVGTLTIDNVTIQKKATAGIFNTGAVTFRFDDAWISQLQNAVPKLNSVGFKGTFYVASQQIRDNGFAGYMSKNEIGTLAQSGHEIGSHTRTHAHLALLSSVQQEAEIQGSRQDILSWNVGPVNSFAYPFGEYNSTTLGIVKTAGYTSAAATIGGYVGPASDRYQLERQSVIHSTTFAQAKGWIDTAAANKRWLILTFHEVNTSGNFYAVTPELFNQIVDYVAQKQIPVVTSSQGAQHVQ
ncbi:MAG: polysaccharide deacetylase family protein [bacterium]|nr:polysaccharide deacetylase family protein [bacterium]